ncbi:hypothetical protein BDZ97DRAFT_1906024 [Flammula alnicola]|nr:hypothetical protein BDZ97DRAFT_1906024 [Flammula alnicola]
MDVDAINAINLDSLKESTIQHINVYADRAQITRLFKVNVAAGQNKVTISSLPNITDRESLRVEARGPVVIHGVASSKVAKKQPDETSPLLEELNGNKEKATDALERYKKALKAIDGYMDKIDVQYLDISKLGEAMEIYDTTEEKWDAKIRQVNKEIEAIEGEMTEEEERLENAVGNKELRTRVVVGLFAESATEIEIVLIYAVSHSSWEPSYDIRANLQNPEAPVKVVYKASITQQTGETWENAPITLETATPTFDLELPYLDIWKISETMSAAATRRLSVGGKRARKILADPDDLDYAPHKATVVTSKGNVNATFRIPGKSTIPSNEEAHDVTIAELQLDANMSWMCIPKGDDQVHLKATIKNSSEYTFLAGSSNVYVDQSFIASSLVPRVSPQEVFECLLGLDPSIRLSESGFYNKSRVHSFSQRITVHNTKIVNVEGIKIVDHIPVSQDANISINLISPALTLPKASASGSEGKVSIPASVQVSEGVVAKWRERLGYSAESLGENGQLEWVCSIPALGKVNLLLQWDVTAPHTTHVYGLY